MRNLCAASRSQEDKVHSMATDKLSSLIETGRYGTSTSLHHRVCNFCSSGDKETLELLFSLITAEPIIEDEDHFLRDCPNYNQLREERSKELKELLLAKNFMELFSERHIFKSSSGNLTVCRWTHTAQVTHT